ncbi:hypothetical protein HPB48_022622 [Haemaphysalis longicornis]|uniref:Uncharacterized protein n=1 Tax=Haemaphysalis longicornis TaxID=44386 RepID=A0A9J6GZN3_HAELO|nr:hypothetical protein HPB48_022622 [Haemaphysalis longicornis]
MNRFSTVELVPAPASAKTSASPGPDNMSYKVLSQLGEKEKMGLLGIFRLLLGKLATQSNKRKYARIVAVVKPRKIPTFIESCSSISHLSCISKVVEKKVLHRLDGDLITRNAYLPQMSRFREERSSVDNGIALAKCINQIRTQANINMSSDQSTTRMLPREATVPIPSSSPVVVLRAGRASRKRTP